MSSNTSFASWLCRETVRLLRLNCFAVCALTSGQLLFAATPTTTTLSAVSTAQAQLVVTLTATVTGGGGPVSPGQVVFCNASAPHCEDLAILGTAQLTSHGTATLKVLMLTGQHKLYAKFLGTKGTTSFSASSSLPNIETVTVATKQKPVTAQIFTAGTAASRTLSATIDVGAAPATGTVSFRDVTDGHQIASAALDTAATKFGFDPGIFQPTGSLASTVGDLNNDGVPDLLGVISYSGTTSTALLSISYGDLAHPGHFLAPQYLSFPNNELGVP